MNTVVCDPDGVPTGFAEPLVTIDEDAMKMANGLG